MSVCYIQQGDVCCSKCVHQNVDLRWSDAFVLRHCASLLLVHPWMLIIKNTCEIPLNAFSSSTQCRWQTGATGAVYPGPQCDRGPKQCWTLQIRSGSSFRSPSSFFKRFVSLYCWFQVQDSLLFWFALTLLMQTSNNAPLSYVTSAQPLLGPVHRTFDLKPKMKTVTGMYICTVWTVCMSEKEPQKPPEHTSEQVKSQNFLGACAPDPPHTIYKRGPTFCICPGPPQSSWRPWQYIAPIVVCTWVLWNVHMHVKRMMLHT